MDEIIYFDVMKEEASPLSTYGKAASTCLLL